MLTDSLGGNLEKIREDIGQSSDIIIRIVKAGVNHRHGVGVIYTDGLADKETVQNFILESLLIDLRESFQKIDAENFFLFIKDCVLKAGEVKEISDFQKVYFHVLSGDTVILVDGIKKALAVGTRGWQDRGVNEPSSQIVVRGPKDGFTETLRTNTALVRRRIRDKNLRIETKQIGKITKTDVCIMYIKGIVQDKIVDEVRQRLERIEIDGILESGYIEEYIQDETFTPFPTVYNTERPDIIAAALLEGKVAILVDGTPFALVVPALFVSFFQASEDYYQRFDISTFIRLLRYLAFFIALITPSFYIAVTTFHQEMLPTPLLISIMAQREGVPFPAFVEALLMELTFEILREAGTRMPRAVGQAISIVGALVIGEAAVQAGLVSPVMVIVVSITAISSFISPTFNMAISIRILRFLFMGLAASFGFFGIILGMIALVLHLTSLRSFGIPYMSPLAPFFLSGQKDSLIRMPRWMMLRRPSLINQTNIIRDTGAHSEKPKSREIENETSKQGNEK
ncbi:spore germination protein KA [Anoxybacillus vitaminiphilus]|uniref:Spore germination protein KA n=1 Tax=Paranoxybacillus vitaminiphilus TaxID=581036 RepID=A0A327YMW8_9BACL|nr:spore germination protein [Anoxybacillus vitaminiphilus]RAK22283.1 spore germination protein KA [Anoxybacillus vitaminiphilus]